MGLTCPTHGLTRTQLVSREIVESSYLIEHLIEPDFLRVYGSALDEQTTEQQEQWLECRECQWQLPLPEGVEILWN